MIGDSKEQIERCLNCKRPSCINCAKSAGEPRKKGRNVKPVVAFGHGEDVRYESMVEAARALIVAPQSIRQAIRNGGKCLGYYWRYGE